MEITIAREQPDSTDAWALITELDAYLNALYPEYSNHGLSVDGLVADDVSFYVLRVSGAAAGCAALKQEGAGWAEIKRVYVRPQFRGNGLAKRLLLYLESVAKDAGMHLLRLESGVYQPEALMLFEALGFHRVPAFGSFAPDPLSVYYEKRIE